MKKFYSVFSFLVFALIAFSFSGCGGGGGESTPAEEKQLEKLIGTWTLESAALGSDITWSDDFEGLQLTLAGDYSNGGTYSYAFDIDEWPMNSPWPENGDWKFGGTSGTDLTSEFVRLDDSQTISYTVTENELTFTFTYNGDGFQNEARTSSVEGNWVFVFTR